MVLLVCAGECHADLLPHLCRHYDQFVTEYFAIVNSLSPGRWWNEASDKFKAGVRDVLKGYTFKFPYFRMTPATRLVNSHLMEFQNVNDRFPLTLPIWHFKWRSGVIPILEQRIPMYQKHGLPYGVESERALEWIRSSSSPRS